MLQATYFIFSKLLTLLVNVHIIFKLLCVGGMVLWYSCVFVYVFFLSFSSSNSFSCTVVLYRYVYAIILMYIMGICDYTVASQQLLNHNFTSVIFLPVISFFVYS